MLIVVLFFQITLGRFTCHLDPSFQRLINESLKPFENGITLKMIQKAKQGPRLCVVKIRNHTVEENCLLKEHKCFLRSVARNVPDLEFVLNYDDRPRVYKHNCEKPEDYPKCACDSNFTVPPHAIFIQTPGYLMNDKVPIFSQCTISECYLDILFPAYLHFDYNFRKHNWQPWENKKFKAIWRGTSTGGYCNNWEECRTFQRQKLVELCSKIKDCDAGFHRIDQCSEEVCQKMKEVYGVKQADDFLDSKIIIDIDGNSYSGRYPYLLEGKAVVFKIFVFDDIVTKITNSWEHYIPVKMDLSDLEEKLNWGRQNDQALKKIGENAKKRSKQVMHVHSYECYVVNLLRKYHSLFNFNQNTLINNLQQH